MDSSNFFTTADHAHLYYEDVGSGTPIVLVPGFMCTTRFYNRNVAGLKDKYRVITLDSRGYGLSSKSLVGNNLRQHAQDVKDLIDYLKLDQVVLMGWSLGAAVVSVYTEMFGEHKLAAIGLIDAFLSPFQHGEWNEYKFAGYRVREYIQGRSLWFTDPDLYHQYFFNTVACDKLTDEDKKWIVEEISMTMPWTGIELHLDACHTDSIKPLEKVKVPMIVYTGNSKGIPASVSLEVCRRLSCEYEYHHFDTGGHMFFYSEAEEFNSITDRFIQKVIRQ